MGKVLLQEVEDIHSRTFGRGARAIGVTSPQKQSGVSTIARSLATRCALSGQSAILIDMSKTSETTGSKQDIDEHDIHTAPYSIKSGEQEYDVLEVNQAGPDKYRYRNVRELQDLMQKELAHYNQIVVDLTNVPDDGQGSIPVGIGAAACDAVVLVCHTHNVTQSSVETAIKSLANNNAKVAGLVMNDQNAPTMVHEILREMDRISWLLPKGVQDFIASKVSHSKMLNNKQ